MHAPHPSPEAALKAEPSRQRRLLDLQAFDTRLDQIDHKKATLPVLAELASAQQEVETLEVEVVKARTAVDDVQREIGKAEADVQLVRDRAARNQARLDAGQGTAKDMQALQHELESLARRQTELEDVELEIMERAEGLEATLGQHEKSRTELGSRLEQLESDRDSQLAELDTERAQVAGEREQTAPDVGDDLLALYDKIRASSGGLGAAALAQRRCGGCRLELNQVDLGRIASAPEDEVVRCEECRRILVRTPESGI